MDVLVRRGNGERLVPQEKVAEFLALGYSVIDSAGKVLVEAEPMNLAECKKMLAEVKKERDSLKDQNEALSKKVIEAETALAEVKKRLKETLEAKKETQEAIQANYSANKADHGGYANEPSPEIKTRKRAANGAETKSAK
ncbi:MAG: hypothetical protein IKO94_01190 [Selenomonadaceae bacterium]|nr:hypothetical protein [Clostridia bacterium]MBR4694678.1 hypothetical protein [Selenomonadaceae bacterium]